jgi:hypothetical protein
MPLTAAEQKKLDDYRLRKASQTPSAPSGTPAQQSWQKARAFEAEQPIGSELEANEITRGALQSVPYMVGNLVDNTSQLYNSAADYFAPNPKGRPSRVQENQVVIDRNRRGMDEFMGLGENMGVTEDIRNKNALGRVTGEVATAFIPVGVGAGLAAKAPAAGQTLTRLGKLGDASKRAAKAGAGLFAGGAGYGATTEARSPEEIRNNMLISGLTNVAIPAAGKAVQETVKGTGQIAASLLGRQSGVGSEAVKEAFKAGRKGGSAEETLIENMRDPNFSPEAVVNMANNAVGDMRKSAQQRYQTARKNPGNTGWAQNTTLLDFKPIDDLIKKYKSAGYSDNGKIIINRDAADTYVTIKNIVEKYKANAARKNKNNVYINRSYYMSAEGLDDLKKSIRDLQNTGALKDVAGPGRGGYRVASDVTAELGNIIKAVDPKYTEAMKDYEDVAETLQQLKETLKLTGSKGANYDKSLRALQKILRNNANTNYGAVRNLGDKLVDAGAENLMPALAGQTFRAYEPRGIVNAAGALGTGGAGYFLGEQSGVPGGGITGALAGLAGGSPRLVGESAKVMGDVARVTAPARNVIGKTPVTQLALVQQKKEAEDRAKAQKRADKIAKILAQ